MKNDTPNRRQFIKAGSTAAVAASAISFPTVTFGKPDSRKLKIGFIGCGGRGTGAAAQALNADSNVELWSMGEVFRDRLDRSLANISKGREGKINVDEKRKFVGLDAYKQVLDSGVDVVILTTPPGFRPLHFKAAVEAGKHIFLEKPMATDAPGLRSVMESAELAKKKGLAVVAGFCWRYHYARREFFKRIMEDGAIGDVQSIYATYYTGPVKPMPPDTARKEEWSDIEWQVRNWYNFNWLSGDGYVEQAIHTVDWVGWLMKDRPPVSCTAVGGRQIPAHGGNIFDHMEVNYYWDDHSRGTVAQRQISGCHNENSFYVLGSEGEAWIKGGRVYTTGKNAWRYRGPKNNMYQTEHDTLFSSIRKGEPFNDGEKSAHSTMVAIMGRMASYTGQKITYEKALASKEDLTPPHLDWDKELPVPRPPVPGVTRFA